MWRRTYLLLLLLRVYFALSPSYLHPDETFQGPEVIAGSIFPYPSHLTWEWTSDHPIRSVFPLWLFYGVPMGLFKSLWAREDGTVKPAVIYYGMRLVMFIFSFVLEDWAVHELVHSHRRQKQAVALVASSYVTWTFQTHTFSNSFETMLVLWSLVLIDRIVRTDHRSSIASCITLGFVLILGLFNRITFPAFVVIPGLRLLPHFVHRPFSFLLVLLSVAFWAFIAIATDTAYYVGPTATKSFRALFSCLRATPVITPYNNIVYNTQTANLAQHGIHPRYQHILVNMPQLLGPAMLLLLSATPYFAGSRLSVLLRNSRFMAAASGTLILSIIPHQEARFLMPCIPLLLTCMQLPSSLRSRRLFWLSWVTFNIILGVIMGVFHQGGIVPTQLAVPDIVAQALSNTQSKATDIQVFWWKTYPPPTYLLGSNHVNPHSQQPLNFTSTSLMGFRQSGLNHRLSSHLPPCRPTILDRISETIGTAAQTGVYLAAPLSAWRPHAEGASLPSVRNFTLLLPGHNDDKDERTSEGSEDLRFNHIYTYRNHLNLDDMDFGDDGVLPTLERVVGRRGLGVWLVERECQSTSPPDTAS